VLNIRFKTYGQLFALIGLGLFCFSSLAADWTPVDDESVLSGMFSDTTQTATLKDGVEAVAIYNSDGSGVLKAWGASYARQWKVEDGGVCTLVDHQWRCFDIERNTASNDEYRATRKDTGEQLVIRVSDHALTTSESAGGDSGGPAAPSADEIAKELANPNTPLASLTFKFQQRSFEGDIPGADSQNGSMVLFQPSLPFPLESGKVVLFRPAIPILIAQPAFKGGSDWDDESGIGDITFDLALASTNKETGLLTAIGIISTLPTATKDELGADRYTIGPEFLIGKISKNYVIGAFPNHQWDVGGSGDADINLTTMQVFGVLLPGGGWNYGSSPTMSYDHNENEWTIPLNFNFGKTVVRGGRPFKLSVEFNYYVEQPDAFGPEWMIGFSIAPVVKNALADWFK